MHAPSFRMGNDNSYIRKVNRRKSMEPIKLVPGDFLSVYDDGKGSLSSATGTAEGGVGFLSVCHMCFSGFRPFNRDYGKNR